ncbi:NAD(P)/FAD-dependent oxidoreductase [Phytomonospora endophytica]|uniref:Glycine/D-amino acid oxidase-like deaminating enzyme n=1 Tax=Phytomonospora endophytica TaxID=714109 RepID=A0A841FUL9_9ACTN|nr:FAD-binding oxidoreductase [Phytomonospora endophytica]MBB6036209.1 glycine/D-amino acid oxidase-like deaminating enzyme [Phytomonospora endophytica]GIG67115.1 D-amino-acid oxidase [Phytomonospora endophytica]
MTDRSIVVVGAGIVGACLAYRLAGRGRPVVLVDAGSPGSGATRASFAWIGRPRVSDLPSAPLRHLALDEYRRLETELPGLAIRWTGSVSWDGFDDSPGTRTTDVTALEPHLRHPPAEAVHRPEDAALDPLAATELLVAAARDRGARVLTGTEVTGLDHHAGTVHGVRTGDGVVPAETVVLAAGTGAAALCSTVGVDLPVESSPAVLVRLRAKPGLVRTIVATPSLEARQLDDGTILAPTNHHGETDRAALMATARRVRDRFAASFTDADDTEVVSVEIGRRPMPADGEPVIGRPAGTRGLYVAVMHSAITLAAAAARLAADEILTGRPAPELAGCRPDRFR